MARPARALAACVSLSLVAAACVALVGALSRRTRCRLAHSAPGVARQANECEMSYSYPSYAALAVPDARRCRLSG